MIQMQQDYLKIQDRLLLLDAYLKINAKNKLYDLNVHSQEIMAEIFNRFYGWNLIDANKLYPNIQGIDLIDENQKIFIQVTSERSTKKIKKTLTQTSRLVNHNKKWNGFTLYIIGLFIEDFPVPRKGYRNYKTFNFNKNEGLVNLTKIIGNIGSSSKIDNRKSVIEYLEKEIYIENPTKFENNYTPKESKTLKKFIDVLGFNFDDEQIEETRNDVNEILNNLTNLNLPARKIFTSLLKNMTNRHVTPISIVLNDFSRNEQFVKDGIDELCNKHYISEPFEDDSAYSKVIEIYKSESIYSDFWFDLKEFCEQTENNDISKYIVELDFSLLD